MSVVKLNKALWNYRKAGADGLIITRHCGICAHHEDERGKTFCKRYIGGVVSYYGDCDKFERRRGNRP